MARTPVRTALLSVAGLLVVGLAIGHWTGAKHVGPIPWVGRGAAAGVLLFAVTGAAAAAWLTPEPMRHLWPVFALPAGAALGPLALTVLGFAFVPLSVSLWLVLAFGLFAWWRWARGRVPKVDWWGVLPWVLAALLAFLIATVPDWRLNETTIFGDNPDSHQVVGSAVLLQQAPPWQTRAGLPIHRVPTSWRFRYPILYAIAGASNLSHYDPIYVFPAMSALLAMLAALGFGVLAVLCLRLPARAGPWVAMTVPLNAFVLNVVWHPYYNQLWGLALLPWTSALGWYAVRERSRAAGAGFALMLVALALAYPGAGVALVLGARALASPRAVLYPRVRVAAMAWPHRLRPPPIPRPRTRVQW